MVLGQLGRFGGFLKRLRGVFGGLGGLLESLWGFRGVLESFWEGRGEVLGGLDAILGGLGRS